jgi:2-polyprenyl-6-methoxyphenol hydroxylase-like FAD-dependent oxidoreductase
VIDVLVAGGGPAGLATAIRCALAGLEVTVAEPRAGPIDKACGEGLMPAAVTGLAEIGVDPGGRAFRGIRYLDERHQADGLFRGGPGLGVRRTELHAALSLRAKELGVSVRPIRVDGFAQEGQCVRAAGMAARYLVAADGLHSAIRRACALDPPASGWARYGLRRHYRLAPWSRFVEVYWSAESEAGTARAGLTPGWRPSRRCASGWRARSRAAGCAGPGRSGRTSGTGSATGCCLSATPRATSTR